MTRPASRSSPVGGDADSRRRWCHHRAMASDPAQTGIAVVGRHTSLNWTLLFTKLTVEVDGLAHVGPWRGTLVPVPPGEHEVRVYFRYVGQPRCGEAATRVTVGSDGPVRLRYGAPAFITGAGTLDVLG